MELLYKTGILTWITVGLVILKLIGTIDWGWFWVIIPALAPIGILVICVFYEVFKFENKNKNKEEKANVVDSSTG